MMDLEVYNEQNKLVCKLDNDSALLGSYPLEDNMRLHVGRNESYE
jgi:tubulin-folding cofactor B